MNKSNKKIIKALEKGLPNSENLKNDTIIIVGAGIAGLTAGLILHLSGANVIILEAQEYLGGRIKTLENFANQPIELGAEFVHGENSVWYYLLQKNKIKLQEIYQKGWEYYSINGQLWSEKDLENNEDFRELLSLKNQLYAYHHKKEISIQSYLQKEEIAPEPTAILEAWIGSEYGDSLENISLPSFKKAGYAWQAGSKNFILPKNTKKEVLEKIFSPILSNIQYHQKVNYINYQDEKIVIKTIDNQEFIADKVIISVPIGVLQKNVIQFVPSLPLRRQEAIKNLKMPPIIKVILKFEKPFWQEDITFLYSAFPHVIEFYPATKGEKEPYITAYLTGKEALQFQKDERQGINFLLEVLCDTFNSRQPNFDFKEANICDWSKNEWIAGGYTIPSPKAYFWRKKLSLPLRNKIFWAGEATSARHPASVNGALETGYRVAKEIWIGEE
jgi:monoamine oxidase